MNRKLTTKRKVNKYGLGEWLKKNSEGVGKAAFSKENLGGTLGELTGGITQVAEAGIANAQIKDTSAEHASIENTANTTFDASDADSLAAMWDNTLLQKTGYTSDMIRGVTKGQMVGNTLKGAASGAMTGAKMGGLWGGIGGFFAGAGAGVAGILTGNAKARREAANLNAEATLANKQLLANYDLANENMENANFNKGLLNFAAYGGPINNYTGDWIDKNYIENEEYDLDEKEIQRLLNLGYEIEYV